MWFRGRFPSSAGRGRGRGRAVDVATVASTLSLAWERSAPVSKDLSCTTQCLLKDDALWDMGPTLAWISQAVARPGGKVGSGMMCPA